MVIEGAVAVRGMRAGVWALVFGLLSGVWIAAAAGLALWAMSDAAPPAVGVIAYVLFLLGFFLVPVSAVLAVVFGIVALARNRPAGKILGGIGVLLGLGLGVLVVSLILGSDGLLGAISF